MDFNKEEAIRAKGIAEAKMQNQDFGLARKLVLKAQQLNKDLENISQMLMVCDVHCCAEKKLFGNEMDWYSILQIEHTADEATIKKQYRKFALLLHPDKNKFPGAEAAFKLIGEAQRVLLDKGKRSLHDIKRNAAISKPAPYGSQQKPTNGPNFGVQNNFRSNFTGFNPLQRQQPTQHSASQHGFSNGRATFWTTCPFCRVKYQYYVEVMNKALICQTCSKPFVAYESIMQGAPPAANSNQSAFSQNRDVPVQGFSKVEIGGQGNSSTEQCKTEFFQKKGRSNNFSSQKVTDKRQRKKEADSSESCDTESSIDTEEDVPVDEDGEFKAGVDLGCHGERRRRSDRHKQHVSYKENQSDDEELVSHPKKAKRSGSFHVIEEGNKNGSKDDLFETNSHSGLNDQSAAKQKEDFANFPNKFNDAKSVKGKEKNEENGYRRSSEDHIDSTSDVNYKPTSDPEIYDYPDPDFNDFDKGRGEGCFSAGQIWAAYDTLDAMPRFYARIRKVFSSEFKLRITWLEPDPDGEDEIEWVNEGLPASCGKFRSGDSESTTDHLMFSHIVNWEKGSQRETFKIFPRKGEIWAIFKNWDIKWKIDSDPSKKYEYDFVEILSEYTEGSGARVAYLSKVKGFVSLFCRIKKEGNNTLHIPAGELFRFSHMIPSFKLTGKEKEGVPKGSFELDPASLPKGIEEVTVPEDFVVEASDYHSRASGSRSSDQVKPEMESEATGQQADGKDAHPEPEVVDVNEDYSVSPASYPEAMEIPEPEFCNFDAEKSIEKFQVGQVWALYSDEDGLPKYYGQITKVASDLGFIVKLRWLTACALPNNVIQWHDKDMLLSCGKFRLSRGESVSYTSANCFSHQPSAESTSRKNEYTILPRKGQVWALYRNWTPEIKLENCEYEIVEVLEENDLHIRVLFLKQVDGFNSVFKSEVREGSAVLMDVLRTELLRFSHQIPAFRLTDERDGSLRGCLELDPAALPVHYFHRK